MSFLNDVKTRRSVRTFDGNDVEPEVLKDLEEFAAKIENPYGIPVRFKFLNAKEYGLSSPVLSGEKLYVSAMMKKGEHAEEAYGYSFEALLVHAHKLGLGTVWIGGTMPRDKFEKASDLTEGELMPCVSPLGKAADKMGVKEVLMRKGVGADKRFDFGDLFFKGDFETPLSENDARKCGIYEALEAVRWAPSAVNKQPWRIVVCGNVAHVYEKHDKGYINENYDLQKIDIGIALYRLEQGILDAGKTPKFVCKDPGIIIPSQTDYVASIEF
ncbi:MAG: nitroreductase family protein [Lachnospiraceae bacterium]|nr:nitroreductase family protein [Lachnospiraceae bacterium]